LVVTIDAARDSYHEIVGDDTVGEFLHEFAVLRLSVA